MLPAHLLRLEAVYLRAWALLLPELPALLTLAHLPAPATLVMFAQHLRRLWAQVQHRAAIKFPPNLTPNEAALLVAGALSEYWATIRPGAAPPRAITVKSSRPPPARLCKQQSLTGASPAPGRGE